MAGKESIDESRDALQEELLVEYSNRGIEVTPEQIEAARRELIIAMGILATRGTKKEYPIPDTVARMIQVNYPDIFSDENRHVAVAAAEMAIIVLKHYRASQHLSVPSQV